jgi:hypothetical protein
MRDKLRVLPVDQKAEWWTVVHLELNDAGDVRVEWHPNVLANPYMVNEVLQALVYAAEQAWEDVEAPACSNN